MAHSQARTAKIMRYDFWGKSIKLIKDLPFSAEGERGWSLGRLDCDAVFVSGGQENSAMTGA